MPPHQGREVKPAAPMGACLKMLILVGTDFYLWFIAEITT